MERSRTAPAKEVAAARVMMRRVHHGPCSGRGLAEARQRRLARSHMPPVACVGETRVTLVPHVADVNVVQCDWLCLVPLRNVTCFLGF